MVESDIVLLYIWSRVWESPMQWDPVWRLYRPLRCLFPVTTAEGPRHIHQQGVGGIVYARGALGHTNYCGTRRSDNPVGAS
jgi:hypothetical protein